MNRIPPVLLFILLCIACKGIRNVSGTSTETTFIQLSPSDSLRITVETIDLSEDMSRLSSKNDEVLILLYEFKDSLTLDKPLFSWQLKLDETTRSKKAWFSVNKKLIDTKLLFFLIEQDSETPIEQIDPIIRVQYQRIIEAFKTGNYIELEKYMGDEDLLGVKTISELSKGEAFQFRFRGSHKLDKFDYVIRMGE